MLKQVSERTLAPGASPIERYEFKPFFGSSHFWAINQCFKLSPTTKVLDIGCGKGAIGSKLKEHGFNELFAVEIDAEARSFVQNIYTKVEPNIEVFEGKKFGLILLLDVLEHMSDPFSYLAKVTELLAPQGVILISVPNVAHWSVRLPLIFGSFNYTSRGILDRTHLQFFTRTRVRSMVQSVSTLKLSELNVSIPPLEFSLPKVIWDNGLFRSLNKLHWKVAQILPGFFGYQHLALLHRNS